jgi:hypothetical protein
MKGESFVRLMIEFVAKLFRFTLVTLVLVFVGLVLNY